MQDQNNTASICGFVALVGRPNVGKSTLLNRLLGRKISITSKKPQTTRHQILGVHSFDNTQVVYVDTPGLHRDVPKAINKYMNRQAKQSLVDVDAVVLMVDARGWHPEDEWVLELLKHCKAPVILALNKVDTVDDKAEILPLIDKLQSEREFKTIIPISAATGHNIEKLEQVLTECLPEGPHLFPDDQVSNRSMRFMAAELIREKCFRETGEEVPYGLTVEIEQFKLDGNMYRIAGLIYVEREGQKKIIIGKKGEKLKTIGMKARCNMELLLGYKVYLQLWVKIKRNWADDDRALKSLGYQDE